MAQIFKKKRVVIICTVVVLLVAALCVHRAGQKAECDCRWAVSYFLAYETMCSVDGGLGNVSAGVNLGDVISERYVDSSRYQRVERWREALFSGEGTGSDYYFKYKDSKRFEKEMAKQFGEVLSNFKDKVSITQYHNEQEFIASNVNALEQQGLYFEAVRDVVQDYLSEKKAESILNLEDLIMTVESDFYIGDLISRDDIYGFYRDELDKAIKAQDVEAFDDSLEHIIANGYIEDCIEDEGRLVDTLMDFCEVYACAPGLGGFYDGYQDTHRMSSSSLGAAGMASIGSETSSSTQFYFGDFSVARSTKSSYVEGLVDQASKDKYNTSKTKYTGYFRGNKRGSGGSDIDTTHLIELNGHGDQNVLYALAKPTAYDENNNVVNVWPVLYVGKGIICTSPEYCIKGSFGDIVSKLEAAYVSSVTVPAEDGESVETEAGATEDSESAEAEAGTTDDGSTAAAE